MTNKFKVGDHVRTIKDNSGCYGEVMKGSIGKLSHISSSTPTFGVVFEEEVLSSAQWHFAGNRNDKHNEYMRIDELELISKSVRGDNMKSKDKSFNWVILKDSCMNYETYLSGVTTSVAMEELSSGYGGGYSLYKLPSKAFAKRETRTVKTKQSNKVVKKTKVKSKK